MKNVQGRNIVVERKEVSRYKDEQVKMLKERKLLGTKMNKLRG